MLYVLRRHLSVYKRFFAFPLLFFLLSLLGTSPQRLATLVSTITRQHSSTARGVSPRLAVTVPPPTGRFLFYTVHCSTTTVASVTRSLFPGAPNCAVFDVGIAVGAAVVDVNKIIFYSYSFKNQEDRFRLYCYCCCDMISCCISLIIALPSTTRTKECAHAIAAS